MSTSKPEVTLVGPKTAIVGYFVLCAGCLLLGVILLYRHTNSDGRPASGVGYLFFWMAINSLVTGINRIRKYKRAHNEFR